MVNGLIHGIDPHSILCLMHSSVCDCVDMIKQRTLDKSVYISMGKEYCMNVFVER